MGTLLFYAGLCSMPLEALKNFPEEESFYSLKLLIFCGVVRILKLIVCFSLLKMFEASFADPKYY